MKPLVLYSAELDVLLLLHVNEKEVDLSYWSAESDVSVSLETSSIQHYDWVLIGEL